MGQKRASGPHVSAIDTTEEGSCTQGVSSATRDPQRTGQKYHPSPCDFARFGNCPSQGVRTFGCVIQIRSPQMLSDALNQTSFKEFCDELFNRLQAAHPHDSFVLILDNCSAHSENLLKDVCNAQPNRLYKFLPVYSPR